MRCSFIQNNVLKRHCSLWWKGMNIIVSTELSYYMTDNDKNTHLVTVLSKYVTNRMK